MSNSYFTQRSKQFMKVNTARLSQKGGDGDAGVGGVNIRAGLMQ